MFVFPFLDPLLTTSARLRADQKKLSINLTKTLRPRKKSKDHNGKRSLEDGWVESGGREKDELARGTARESPPSRQGCSSCSG